MASGDARHRGRGAESNPAGRFERLAFERDAAAGSPDEPEPDLKTEFYRDHSKSIVSFNDSPDLPHKAMINPYRGCEHGCAYCYARPYHEYVGLSAGMDFESRIFVKTEAPALLRAELSARTWTPQTLSLSGITDAYQPVERRLQLTRACVEVLAEFRNPVAIITKNHLVTRDIDLLAQLAAHQAAQVVLSITTLDDELAGAMEPRASRPALRLDAIRAMRDAGIPVAVMVAPIIPGLTDHEVPAILKAAADAGATAAGHVVLRLPHGVKDLFAEWLATHAPLRKDRVLNRVRDMRGGALNDTRFGSRMRGEGPVAESVHQLFALQVRKLGFGRFGALSTQSFVRPGGSQGSLF
jgi:DNA repair photolyase